MASNIWSGSGFTEEPGMPAGSYNPDTPPWPAGQVPGLAFVDDATTGFVYVDNGQAKEIIFVTGSVEAARVEQKYSTSPTRAFLVAMHVQPDTDLRSESTVGSSTSPYHVGYFDTLSLGQGSAGTEDLIFPSQSVEPIGYDYTAGHQGWYFSSPNGTTAARIKLTATHGSTDPTWQLKPMDDWQMMLVSGSDVGGDTVLSHGSSANLFIPAVDSDPVDTPTDRPGFVAIKYNTSNNKLWIYNSGWVSTTLA